MSKEPATYLYRWVIPLLVTALFFGILLFFYPFNSGDSTLQPPLGWALWSIWTSTDEGSGDYSYCLLVPVIVAFLVYEKRRQLAKIPAQGSSSAIWWILLGLMLFWVGSRAGKQYLGCAGIQVLLAGTMIWFWGPLLFRALLFAWTMISFAWPLPFFDTTVAFPLRMIVSHLAYRTLNLIAIPCIQSGTALISAPDLSAGLKLGDRFQIDVADPCSGLHSLLPLLMFSACFSATFLRQRWHQWLVFLSSIPLVIVGNVIRIMMLVIGSIQWGTSFAIGANNNPSWYHEDCGYFVFVIVLGLESLLGFFLVRVDRKRSHANSTSSSNGLSAEGGDTHPHDVRVPLWRSTVFLGLTVLALIAWALSPPLSLIPQAGVLMNLPNQLKVPELTDAEFFGFDAAVSDAEHRMLPKDTEYARKNYDDFHGHNIFFSIVLSGKQQYTIHPPQICLVAQGWTIVKEENVPIKLKSGHDLEVRNLWIQRDEIGDDNQHRLVHAYYMYWYVAEGVTTPSQFERNWLSTWDRLLHNRDHRWAYVIAMSPITEKLRADGLNPDQTRQLLTDFIRQIIPNVQKSEVVEDQELGGS